MKFVLIDRILEIEPGKRIVAQKAVSLAEEYLADHFPRFPVLPGVFMLEALVQASSWAARAGLDFAPSMIVLKDVRNVTYKSFVSPGQVLTIESACKELSGEQSLFQASGHVDGREMVKGRLCLRHLNLADRDPSLAELDTRIRTEMRSRFELLTRPRGASGQTV